MNALILDVETTTSNKGNPFDSTNRLVCAGLKWIDYDKPFISYLDETTREVEHIQDQLNISKLIVGFNIKFDLHWLRRIGIDISKIKVWDCQLAEFILSNQQIKLQNNSLNDAAIKYGFKPKLDVVKLEYWDKGIDTDAIPREILSEYLSQDLFLTQQVYEKQLEQFNNNNKLPLFKLQSQDLLVLEEIEYNGIKYNTEKALNKAREIENEISILSRDMSAKIGFIPCNWNSNDHVSCVLYGGTITEHIRIPVGIYKSGAKEGQTRYKIVTKEYVLPKLIEPLEGTEVAKGGYWQVNDTVLRKLKLNKETKTIVSLLSKYNKLEKLRGTYLEGYCKLIEKMNWPKDTLHGILHQTVAITGRLSSSKPNLQNADPITKLFMETRF